MLEIYRNALAMGVAAGVLAIAAQFPRLRFAVPFLALGACGLAFYLGVLDRVWAWDSLRADAAWIPALVFAAWTLHASSGWARASGWASAVSLSAIFGDRFVVLGLAEADPGRRARLVLAASGASLIGLTSGAAPLLLGWGGWRVVALGVALAAVGWTRGGGLSRDRPRPRYGDGAVALLAAVTVWLAAAGGGLELVATALERLPVEFPHEGRWMLAGGAVAAGAVGDEGTVALGAREILARGLSLRGDGARETILAGLAVGGGLPMLLLTRSSLRVGVPLWLVQVAIFAGWCHFS